MKKIKESGFTLIELLGTIVIIGILGTIAVTSVVNIKKSSNSRFDKSQIELMKQAGQTYFTDNKRLLPIVEGQTNYVTLDKLIEKGYINRLYNSKKEEFDPTTSYAWVQKQNDGSYKYDCYCEIKGEKLAGTTAMPGSKVNNFIVTFEYENFYNNKSENKYYTNGKNNSIVKVHLNRNEVSEYRYEIYKKDTKDENSQYKISQREKLTTNLVNIKLNAKDYSDGEYFIKVTTYNSTGNSRQSSSSAKIYIDKTPPTCNITTTYQKDSNSVQNLWYSSKSKNNNNQELGVNSKLPISVDGSDKGSGIKLGSNHIFSDSGYTKQIDKTGTYEAENTGKNGKEYYATVEDNVGNKAKCSQLYYIDTKPPACSEKGIEEGNKGNKVHDKQWYLGDVTTYGYFTDENSGITNEKISNKLTKTSKNAQTSTITQKDNAGNEGSCVINNIYIDKDAPNCDIISDYGYDENSENKAWYSSNSKNASNETIGSGNSVPFYVKGQDNASGVASIHFNGNTFEKSKTSILSVSDTGRGGKSLNASITDLAGNKNTCSHTVWVDTTPPTCTFSTEYEKDPDSDNKEWYSANSVRKVGEKLEKLGENQPLPVNFTYEDSGSELDKIEVKDSTKSLSGKSYQNTIWVDDSSSMKLKLYDKAGNYIKCAKDLKVDTTPPKIEVFNLKRPSDAAFNTVYPDVEVKINDKNPVNFYVSEDLEFLNDVLNFNRRDGKYFNFDGYIVSLESSDDKALTYEMDNEKKSISVSWSKSNYESNSNQQWYIRRISKNTGELRGYTISPVKYKKYVLALTEDKASSKNNKKSSKMEIIKNEDDNYESQYWDIYNDERNYKLKIAKTEDKVAVTVGSIVKGKYDSQRYHQKENSKKSYELKFSTLYNSNDFYNGLPQLYGKNSISLDLLYDGSNYRLLLNAVDLAGNKRDAIRSYDVYRRCSESDLTYEDENFGDCQNGNDVCSDDGVGYQYRFRYYNDKYLNSYCGASIIEQQQCQLPTCCSSTVTWYDGEPTIVYENDKKKWTSCKPSTVTENYKSKSYSAYNGDVCDENASAISIQYDDEIQKECTKWSKCSNGKQTRTCTRYHDYDGSECDGKDNKDFKESRNCESNDIDVSCNQDDKLFGKYKGSNANNFGKWVNSKFHNCNGNITVVGGYERKCINKDCKGMTAKQVNKKWGCSYATLWCNSKFPNAVKW